MKCIKRCYINQRWDVGMGEKGRKTEFHFTVICLVSFPYGTLVWFLLFCQVSFFSPPSFFHGYFPLSHSRDSSALTSSLLFYTYSYLSVCSPLKHLLSALSLRHISSSHCLPTRHFFAAFSVSSHLTNYILWTSLAWKLPLQWISLGLQMQCKPSAQYNLTFMLLRFFKKMDAWLRRVIGDVAMWCDLVDPCRLLVKFIHTWSWSCGFVRVWNFLLTPPLQHFY